MLRPTGGVTAAISTSLLGLFVYENGKLPYASILIIAETPNEILSDKVRALFERTCIKGRDIFDIWWLVAQAGVKPDWDRTKSLLSMYRTRFKVARPAGHFLNERTEKEAREAIE